MFSFPQAVHCRRAAVTLALALATASCDVANPETAAPETAPAAAASATSPSLPASVPAPERALVLRDTNNRVLTNLNPGFLAHVRERLLGEGRAAEAMRLGRTYDVLTGALHPALMPAPAVAAPTDITVGSSALVVNDPSYYYGCETYVTCSGWLFWQTCTNPLYGCSTWFENSQWAGVFGYPLRHILIADRAWTPPPGAIPPPRIFYTFYRNHAWVPVTDSAGPWPSWANYQIEAFLAIVVGDPSWQVGYAVTSNAFPGFFQSRFGSNGQIVGAPESGQPIQQFLLQVFRLEDGGPIID
jgi:hypothetical protein